MTDLAKMLGRAVGTVLAAGSTTGNWYIRDENNYFTIT
jgi:hypothetical protein